MRFFRNKLTVAISVLSVGFLILIGYSVNRENRTVLENSVGVTLNVVQGTVYNMNDKIRGFIDFITHFSDIKNENQELKIKNSELEDKALNFDSVKSENESLRAMLNFKNRNSYYDNIPCHVINKSGGGILEGYTVDKGSKDGVIKGMVVLTPEGLVGQVTSVAENWSIVQLLGNENIAVAAMVANKNDNTGIVKGYKSRNNTLLAKIYSLPLDSTVKVGDVITTSGEGFIYPKGIRIGEVLEVEEDKGKVMKNALIKPYVDFNKVEQLFIIAPKDKTIIKYQGEDIK